MSRTEEIRGRCESLPKADLERINGLYLLSRVERLEAALREIGNEAMSNATPDRGFRSYVHTAVGFALEESDGE